jgi:hypothetical protein
MVGFLAGAGNEIVTGTPTLRQIGLMTPNPDLFTVLAVLMGGATLLATAQTLVALQNGTMPARSFYRYASFFGLSAERIAEQEAAERKRAGDFTSALKADDVAAAKAEGSLADSVLTGEAAPAAARVAAAAPAMASDEVFAKDVERTNGRWAMLGFASLILTEANTGSGLVGQLEMYAKFVGLLGTQSGF